MGDLRFFATPKGLLKPDELPEKWGLLELDDRCVRVKQEAVAQTADKRCEVKMLMSAIRRLEISTAVFVRSEESLEEKPIKLRSKHSKPNLDETNCIS